MKVINSYDLRTDREYTIKIEPTYIHEDYEGYSGDKLNMFAPTTMHISFTGAELLKVLKILSKNGVKVYTQDAYGENVLFK